MKQFILALFFFGIGYTITAQTLDDLEFGTDSTFEAVTWNIEHFPKNGTTTVNYVKQIIENLDVDLWALQEIEDETSFNSIVSGLPGYQGYYAPNYYGLALAFIYNTNTVTVKNIYEIYTSYWNQFPRIPLVIDLTFMGESFIVINNHFKALGDGYLDMYNKDDQEYRRYEASRLLKEYIDTNMPNYRVIVVGDMNDILTEPTYSNNVFQLLLNDNSNYEFADMAIAEGSSSHWSYPFSSYYLSHIDHILITNEMFNEMDNAGSACETIEVDNYMNSYDYYVSDHRPVGIRIKPELGTGISVESISETHLQCYPNPFSGETTIFFDAGKKQSELNIYTINGQKIQSLQVPAGEKSVRWNAEGLPNGIYFAEFLTDKQLTAVTKLVLMN